MASFVKTSGIKRCVRELHLRICVNSSRHLGEKRRKKSGYVDHAKSLLVVAVVLSDGDKIGNERVKRATCSHG